MKKNILIISVFCFFCSLLKSQVINGLFSENRSNTPEITWFSPDLISEDSISIWRANIKIENFQEIETTLIKENRNDTVFYTLIDTTLIEKGIYIYYLLLHFDNDTLLSSDKMYGHNMGDLPAPELISIKTASLDNQKAIELNWKLNYHFTVNSLALYRSTNYDEDYELIAHLPGNAETYIDIVDISNEAYYYFILIHDFFGYQYPSARFHGICSYAESCLAAFDFSGIVKDEEIELSWEVMGDNVLYSQIYRRIGAESSFLPLYQMGVKAGELLSYSDKDISMNAGVDISYYIVNISDGFIQSFTTDTLTFRIKNMEPLPAPRELIYLIDDSQNIKLIWTSMADIENFAGYNIYRSEFNEQSYKLNSTLIPADENFFIDQSAESGKEYTYEVEAVNASGVQGVVRSKVVVNRANPQIVMPISIKQSDNGFMLSWISPVYGFISEIHIFRQKDDEGPVLIKKLPLTQNQLSDSNLPSGDYLYFAVAKLVNGSELMVNNGVLIRKD